MTILAAALPFLLLPLLALCVPAVGALGVQMATGTYRDDLR